MIKAHLVLLIDFSCQDQGGEGDALEVLGPSLRHGEEHMVSKMKYGRDSLVVRVLDRQHQEVQGL